jgi:hypothetical protein
MAYREGAEDRRGAVTPVEVGIAPASESQFYAELSGRILGVFVATMNVLPVDTVAELVVSIPGTGSFRANGIVRFVRAEADDQLPGMGIAFTKIAPADLETATVFCRAFRPPMFYDEG